MGRIIPRAIWVWKRVSDASTLFGLFPKIAGGAVAVAVVVSGIVAGMPWWLWLGGALTLFLLVNGFINALADRRARNALRSPIAVADYLFVDCDAVTDNLGVAKIDNVYSVALCLELSNQNKDGKTLRNLVATLNTGALAASRLHIRGSTGDEIDLRHGETALIEVGRVLVLTAPGITPAMPRPTHRQRVSLDDINYVMNPVAEIRTLAISGSNPVGIGCQSVGRATYIPVVISAADTSAKSMLLELDLWHNNPYRWLKQAKRVSNG